MVVEAPEPASEAAPGRMEIVLGGEVRVIVDATVHGLSASTPIAATHQRRSSSSSFTATSAASRNNPASAPTTASRSYRFRPCNVGAFSAMLSCRGSPGGPAGTGRDFIELLPANGSVIGGALSKKS